MREIHPTGMADQGLGGGTFKSLGRSAGSGLGGKVLPFGGAPSPWLPEPPPSSPSPPPPQAVISAATNNAIVASFVWIIFFMRIKG